MLQSQLALFQFIECKWRLLDIVGRDIQDYSNFPAIKNTGTAVISITFFAILCYATLPTTRLVSPRNSKDIIEWLQGIL